MSDMLGMEQIWAVSDDNFNEYALEIFQYQARNNPIYAKYLQLIDQKPEAVEHYSNIPFLPISFFKTHKVVCSDFEPEAIFESSSTTGLNTSKHYVKSLEDYHLNCLNIIKQHFPKIGEYQLLGLLPNYLERSNSSLVSMVKFLMDNNNQEDQFYLYDHSNLAKQLNQRNSKNLLFGVSFALLDFADAHQVDHELIIIETGGMKGRKKEMTKFEVYDQLQASFPNAQIYSEYGMTELLSQAYSDRSAIYSCPPWMKVLPRADNDPLSHSANGHTAALNIIDLANIHTCSFIATDDLGKIYSDGRFEVSGRLDYSDLRGCSLMVI